MVRTSRRVDGNAFDLSTSRNANAAKALPPKARPRSAPLPPSNNAPAAPSEAVNARRVAENNANKPSRSDARRKPPPTTANPSISAKSTRATSRIPRRLSGAAIDRRRELLNAAVRVFARKGFHASRVGDIAEEACVAHGLLYHYFRSKDEVLSEIKSLVWSML